MLWLLFVVFFVLWIISIAGVITVGGWVWLFLALWIISLIGQFATRNRHTPTVQP